MYLTTIRHRPIEFRKCEKPLLNGNWRTLWAAYRFYQKPMYVSFHQEGIDYCTAQKYSTETVINASSLIISISRQRRLSPNVEVDCQKQQTYCLTEHFLDFSIANLFMILVVYISHRPVVLKVGGIAPLGAILMHNGAKKQKGAKKHKGGENAQLLDCHWVNLGSPVL